MPSNSQPIPQLLYYYFFIPVYTQDVVLAITVPSTCVPSEVVIGRSQKNAVAFQGLSILGLLPTSDGVLIAIQPENDLIPEFPSLESASQEHFDVNFLRLGSSE